MLDDSPEKFTRGSFDNVLFIPTFTVLDSSTDCKVDVELLKTMNFLSDLCKSDIADVREYLAKSRSGNS